ncbi:MAG: VWA domain-containing protein [Gluconacetobacter diazotrophicus]|nr:VWA domain-containing protein [Gluconacetobacter diazotrophicus]
MNWHALTGFGFAQPAWLWLLVLPVGLALRAGRVGGAPAVVYSSTSVLQSIGRPRAARAGAWSGTLLALATAAAVVALARPQLSNSFTQVEASGIDIMIALDVSKSMLTEDFQIGGSRASRVDAIKEITQRFIDARPNDRIGMLAFAGRPYLVSPPTLDHAWLIDNLDRVKIGLVEDGTAIGSAIVSAANRLKNREAKSRIIVLLSDGDNNAGRVNPNTAAEAAKALGLKVYTIGVGTNGVAPFPALDRNGNQMTDMWGRPAYENVQVEFDEKTLSDVAAVAGGHFFRADSSKALQDIYAQIDRLEKSTVKLNKYREYRDLFRWFAGTGVVCLGLYLALSQLLWRRLP